MSEKQTKSGIYEFLHGATTGERDALLAFWSVLGFTPIAEGRLEPAVAARGYEHASGVTSIRLQHAGSERFQTGYVRLQLWDSLRNTGLGNGAPMVCGGRWMGLYTRDILQVRDSFASDQARRDWNVATTPVIHAPLQKPAPAPDFFNPFIGLREVLVFGERFRLAFIQRSGFDRPGFGSFDDALPYRNTEGSHANIVQPARQFSTEFYKAAFEFDTAPFGDATDAGDGDAERQALSLRDADRFRVERIGADDCPTGLLQVYSPYMSVEDLRDRSRPGCGNLSAYSVQVADLDRLLETLHAIAGARALEPFEDEFGNPSVMFFAPDGNAWLAIQR